MPLDVTPYARALEGLRFVSNLAALTPQGTPAPFDLVRQALVPVAELFAGPDALRLSRFNFKELFETAHTQAKEQSVLPLGPWRHLEGLLRGSVMTLQWDRLEGQLAAAIADAAVYNKRRPDRMMLPTTAVTPTKLLDSSRHDKTLLLRMDRVLGVSIPFIPHEVFINHPAIFIHPPGYVVDYDFKELSRIYFAPSMSEEDVLKHADELQQALEQADIDEIVPVLRGSQILDSQKMNLTARVNELLTLWKKWHDPKDVNDLLQTIPQAFGLRTRLEQLVGTPVRTVVVREVEREVVLATEVVDPTTTPVYQTKAAEAAAHVRALGDLQRRFGLLEASEATAQQRVAALTETLGEVRARAETQEGLLAEWSTTIARLEQAVSELTDSERAAINTMVEANVRSEALSASLGKAEDRLVIASLREAEMERRTDQLSQASWRRLDAVREYREGLAEQERSLAARVGAIEAKEQAAALAVQRAGLLLTLSEHRVALVEQQRDQALAERDHWILEYEQALQGVEVANKLLRSKGEQVVASEQVLADLTQARDRAVQSREAAAADASAARSTFLEFRLAAFRQTRALEDLQEDHDGIAIKLQEQKELERTLREALSQAQGERAEAQRLQKEAEGRLADSQAAAARFETALGESGKILQELRVARTADMTMFRMRMEDQFDLRRALVSKDLNLGELDDKLQQAQRKLVEAEQRIATLATVEADLKKVNEERERLTDEVIRWKLTAQGTRDVNGSLQERMARLQDELRRLELLVGELSRGEPLVETLYLLEAEIESGMESYFQVGDLQAVSGGSAVSTHLVAADGYQLFLVRRTSKTKQELPIDPKRPYNLFHGDQILIKGPDLLTQAFVNLSSDKIAFLSVPPLPGTRGQTVIRPADPRSDFASLMLTQEIQIPDALQHVMGIKHSPQSYHSRHQTVEVKLRALGTGILGANRTISRVGVNGQEMVIPEDKAQSFVLQVGDKIRVVEKPWLQPERVTVYQIEFQETGEAGARKLALVAK